LLLPPQICSIVNRTTFFLVFCLQSHSFRITYVPFSIFFVILVSDPLNRFLTRVLPNYKVPLGRYSFSLNPGP
ncbi:unnamed protein product, partial [Penicillium salamii]